MYEATAKVISHFTATSAIPTGDQPTDALE
jgi:hypothetical protein